MAHKPLPASCLTLVLFMAALGCRSSATSREAQSPSPVSSPTLSAKQTAVPTPTPADTRLTSPISVTPPVSFSPEQLPQNGPLTFTIPGTEGDVLVVDVNGIANPEFHGAPPKPVPHTTPEPDYSVSVRLATDGSPAKVLQEGGACTDTWLFLLPRTATYQVVLDDTRGHAQGRNYGIGFRRLAKNDPLVDPGIRPEQVSLDFGDLAKGEQVQVEPPVMAGGCIDGAAPARLTVRGKGIGFRIMSVAGYKKAFPSDEGIAVLQAALVAGKTNSAKNLPYANAGDTGAIIATRQEVLAGDGWRGLRWIGGFGQDPACRPDLGYVFEGITNDGRFLIVGGAGISHPATQQRWIKSCVTDANTRISPAEADTRAHEINTLLERDLASADPTSFLPRLDQLDAVVQSLKIKQ